MVLVQQQRVSLLPEELVMKRILAKSHQKESLKDPQSVPTGQVQSVLAIVAGVPRALPVYNQLPTCQQR
jgi:hypothetical protein